MYNSRKTFDLTLGREYIEVRFGYQHFARSVAIMKKKACRGEVIPLLSNNIVCYDYSLVEKHFYRSAVQCQPFLKMNEIRETFAVPVLCKFRTRGCTNHGKILHNTSDYGRGKDN